MALPLRTHDQTDRRHDRAHRTAVGVRRGAAVPNGSRIEARARCAKRPEGHQPLTLASPPPSQGRGAFFQPPHSAAIWREMMSRWMSDVPS